MRFGFVSRCWKRGVDVIRRYGKEGFLQRGDW